MFFIDTHCHLDAAEFGGTQFQLISDALTQQVTTIVVPSVAAHNFAAVRALAQQHATCAAAYGIHPLYVAQATHDDLHTLRAFLREGEAVAVGEIGLDFYVANVDAAQQQFFFAEQLKLAREFDLPVLLHVRKAVDAVLQNLRQHKVRGGIAHAFNGSRSQADALIKLGFKLGFGGAMTHNRALRIRELAATLPLDSIVLETDAPDMPPAFLVRGEANKPEYLPRIAQTLAALRGISLEQVAEATTHNALSVLALLRR
ncbi:MAG: TatD family hydrolase [Sideroxydans sp.]|nr:TatD family hydrolase [Sideroxydans sp.]